MDLAAAALNWCLHYEIEAGQQPSFTDFCSLLGMEFHDANIYYNSIHSTVRICSPHIITRDQLSEKFNKCFDVSINGYYLDEICATVKSKCTTRFD